MSKSRKIALNFLNKACNDPRMTLKKLSNLLNHDTVFTRFHENPCPTPIPPRVQPFSKEIFQSLVSGYILLKSAILLANQFPLQNYRQNQNLMKTLGNVLKVTWCPQPLCNLSYIVIK